MIQSDDVMSAASVNGRLKNTRSENKSHDEKHLKDLTPLKTEQQKITHPIPSHPPHSHLFIPEQ